MTLQQEIDTRSSKIYREAYQMSIGELINLYKDGEIDIHPEFQRVFRWNDYQKTRFIESIVLNIPIPQIFVSQREDGIWDVVDGVQRLSTIFEFVGIYKDSEGNDLPPLVLHGTEYLPSFEGVSWISNEGKSFSTEQKINFKRSRIDVVIVKKGSDEKSKYELFQRLNTGGSSLTAQEVRNCLMIMTNPDFYSFICDLEEDECFRDCVPVSERKSNEQYRLELISRLLIGDLISENQIVASKDLSSMLDNFMIELCQCDISRVDIKQRFVASFALLYDVGMDGAFKKRKDGVPRGPFLTLAFQGIACGVFRNINSILKKGEALSRVWLKDKIEEFYQSTEFTQAQERGVRPLQAFMTLTEYGHKLFGDE